MKPIKLDALPAGRGLAYLILSVCILFSGCTSGFQKFVDKNVPEGGADKVLIVETFAPSASITFKAEGVQRDGSIVNIDKVVYDRKTGTTSGYIEMEGVILNVSKDTK